MTYFCCDLRRREDVRDHATLNGIDYLEVLDEDAPPTSPRQQTLLAHTFKPVAALTAGNVRIDGGVRVRPVRVLWAFRADLAPAQGVLTPDEVLFLQGLVNPTQVLLVRADSTGDFSPYTLRLVSGPGVSDPPLDFDPILSAVEFSFKVECPTPFDCLAPPVCPPEPRDLPSISYLAKDYASFRRLMLDRMALLIPRWKERNAADLGIALVELLAYVGDSLSYQQDAIGTEAYLATARRRVSVRRHARLVDYFMHDGCNARAWVQIQVENSPVIVPEKTQILTTGVPLSTALVLKGSQEYVQALAQGVQVFETMHRAVLYPMHNTLFFYTWGNEACALPTGVTRATLRDGAAAAERRRLRAGDVLILEERLGPKTGTEADADPRRRHAVRLTRVRPEATLSLVGGVEVDRTPGPPLEDPLTGQPIVEIEWHEEDALPFPFCISSPRTDTELEGQVHEDVSVARGNIVLADHGLTIPGPEPVGEVPGATLFKVSTDPSHLCDALEPRPVFPRFRPRLNEAPVARVGHVLSKDASGIRQRMKFDPNGSATSAFRWEMRRVLPAITASSGPLETWTPEWDLLDSRPLDRHFVAETEEDGTVTLRFGAGEHGMRPEESTTFTAIYRVGNGTRGNVGAEVLAHLADGGIVIGAGNILAIRNPMAARGGVDPEHVEEVRQKAPSAFRIQERAVTPEDYAQAALRYPGLQGAAATFRWTGSWRTVFVTLDPKGQDRMGRDPELKSNVRQHLERFRMAGYDLKVDDPHYVSLEIEMQVCVKPGYFRAHIESALLRLFNNRVLPDGTTGLFHPDRFSFGQPVYLSPLYEAALRVDGVESVRVTIFQQQDRPDTGEALAAGRILLHRLEIARLDNDPNYPEHGVFRLVLFGGQ